MPYQFPPDLDERVKARMTNGAYQSEDDLLREALDALDEREQEKLRRWDERNQIAMEHSRLGLSKPLDLERILGRVEKRITEHHQGE
jgi:Arc/MetJ-type ribon-helix-helix transcriptional regulator